jgi:hypothetical protein
MFILNNLYSFYIRAPMSYEWYGESGFFQQRKKGREEEANQTEAKNFPGQSSEALSCHPKRSLNTMYETTVGIHQQYHI